MRKTSLDLVYQLAKTDERIVFIGSDLGVGVMEQFKKEMPERWFMEGVSEQHIVGMAAGLAMSGKISDRTLLSSRDYDLHGEQAQMRAEASHRAAFVSESQKAQAMAAGEALLIQTKYGMRAQKLQQVEAAMSPPPQPGQMAPQEAPQEPQEGMQEGGPDPMSGVQSQIGMDTVQGGGGTDVGGLVNAAVEYLSRLDPPTQQSEMQRLAQEQPQIHQMVAAVMQTSPIQPIQQVQPVAPVNGGGAPLPEQRPPRRGPGQALV